MRNNNSLGLSEVLTHSEETEAYFIYAYFHGLVGNQPCLAKWASVKIWTLAEATYGSCPLENKSVQPQIEKDHLKESHCRSAAHENHAHESHGLRLATNWWSTTRAFASASKEQERSSLQWM